jgi:hypothetical protein
MARKNKRWEGQPSFGAVSNEHEHTHTPVPTQQGHVCLSCGRPLGDREVTR